MQYLVTMETVQTYIPSSPKELIPWLEQRIIPNDEVLAKLMAEKKILAGGVLAGRKGEAFIIEAASNEELDRLLMSFPMWTLQNVEVIPLDSFEDRATRTLQLLKELKAA